MSRKAIHETVIVRNYRSDMDLNDFQSITNEPVRQRLYRQGLANAMRRMKPIPTLGTWLGVVILACAAIAVVHSAYVTITENTQQVYDMGGER